MHHNAVDFEFVITSYYYVYLYLSTQSKRKILHKHTNINSATEKKTEIMCNKNCEVTIAVINLRIREIKMIRQNRVAFPD